MLPSSATKSHEMEGQIEGEPDSQPLILYDNDDDHLFDTDDENCPWWSEDDLFNSDYDDQQYVPISHELNPQISTSNHTQQQEGKIPVPYFDSNPTNNQNKTLTSNKLLPTVKSWICEHCNAINNLYHSLEERQFKCISCNGHYRPGQILIESKQEDTPIQLYTIWICNHCSYHNDIKWNKCNVCSLNKPQSNLQIFRIADKPKQIQEFNNCNYNSMPKPFSLQSQQIQWGKVDCNAYEFNQTNNNQRLEVNKNNIVQPQQIQWGKVGCNPILEANKNNIASNHKQFANCQVNSEANNDDTKHKNKQNNKDDKNDCECTKNKTFREFDELQNYKSELNDIIEIVDNLFSLDKNNKIENNKLNYTSNWNCDFKFMK